MVARQAVGWWVDRIDDVGDFQHLNVDAGPSSASRRAASRQVSPGSITPPGKLHFPR